MPAAFGIWYVGMRITMVLTAAKDEDVPGGMLGSSRTIVVKRAMHLIEHEGHIWQGCTSRALGICLSAPVYESF